MSVARTLLGESIFMKRHLNINRNANTECTNWISRLYGRRSVTSTQIASLCILRLYDIHADADLVCGANGSMSMELDVLEV